MTATTHELTFNGGLLERGFWLYVWEITTPQDSTSTMWDALEIVHRSRRSRRSIGWVSIWVLTNMPIRFAVT